MDTVDPGTWSLVKTLARSSPDFFVGRAHVERSAPATLLHPEDLANILRQLAETLLGVAQRLAGSPALVGNEAARVQCRDSLKMLIIVPTSKKIARATVLAVSAIQNEYGGSMTKKSTAAAPEVWPVVPSTNRPSRR